MASPCFRVLCDLTADRLSAKELLFICNNIFHLKNQQILMLVRSMNCNVLKIVINSFRNWGEMFFWALNWIG